jgi:hypothetical protein
MFECWDGTPTPQCPTESMASAPKRCLVVGRILSVRNREISIVISNGRKWRRVRKSTSRHQRTSQFAPKIILPWPTSESGQEFAIEPFSLRVQD